MAPRDQTLRGDLALAAACAAGVGLVLWQAFAPPRERPSAREPAIGKVEIRRNDVRRRPRARLSWEELRAGSPVGDNDAVYAATDSRAVIRLDDGARIELDESSLLIVRGPAQKEGASPAVLELVRGSARSEAGSAPLAIRAGDSEVAVGGRGEVRVRRSAGGPATVQVTRGDAVLASAGGNRVELRGGQRALDGASGAQVTSLGVSLLSPEDGATVYFTGAAAKVAFAFAPPEGGSCQLELSGAADFSALLAAAEAPAGTFEDELSAGSYHWRVRCREGAGTLSEERAFSVVREEAPVAMSPRAEEVVDLSSKIELTLSWSEVPDEPAYRLEVAADGAGFAHPAAAATVERAVARLSFDAPEGRYCFRVRAEGRGRQAPWSEPSCFRTIRQPILGAPKVFEPRREPVAPREEGKGAWLWRLVVPAAHAAEPPRSALVLRWERIQGAAGYVLEVAEDREFTRVVVRERTPEPYYRWAVVARRDYFWRVRGVDAAGREGALSQVSRIGSEFSPPSLSAPAPDARLEQEPGGKVALRWQASEVLAAYRVEVSADPSFGRGTVSLEAREPKAAAPARLGRSYWRVIGVDANGQTTEPSEARAFFVVPAAPEPRAPSAGARVVAASSPQPVELSWAARPVARYQVELSRDGRALRTVTAAAATASVPLDSPGRYAWRVRGADPETAWSAPRHFEVAIGSPSPRQPADGAELPAGAAALLGWDPVPLAREYEVEVAKDGAAPQARRVAAAALDLGALPPGRYSWRVRAVAAAERSEPSAAFALTVAAPALEPPKGQPSPQAPRPPAPAPRGVDLAAAAGVTTNFGALVAPSLGAELGWRPSRWGGVLGGSLRASGYAAAQELAPEPGPARVRAGLHAVCIEAAATARLPVGPLWVTASAGPLVRILVGTAALGDGTVLARSSVELGASVHGGAEWRLGPGRAFVDAGVALSTATAFLYVTTPVTTSFSAGYRWEVW